MFISTVVHFCWFDFFFHMTLYICYVRVGSVNCLIIIHVVGSDATPHHAWDSQEGLRRFSSTHVSEWEASSLGIKVPLASTHYRHVRKQLACNISKRFESESNPSGLFSVSCCEMRSVPAATLCILSLVVDCDVLPSNSVTHYIAV